MVYFSTGAILILQGEHRLNFTDQFRSEIEQIILQCLAYIVQVTCHNYARQVKIK